MIPAHKTGVPPCGLQRWRWLGYLLSAAALAWVVALWWDQWPQVSARLAGGRPAWLALGLLLALGSGYASFLAFVLLARRLVARTLKFGDLSHLYFVAQLLKHLPGRVWGIGYQVAQGRREGAASQWVTANLAHMGAASYIAVMLAIVVVLGGSSPVRTAGVLLVAVGLYWLVLPVCRWLGLRLGSRGVWRARLARVLALGGLDRRAWALVFLAFGIAGLLQYGSWAAYAGAAGLADLQSALVLCAFYMLAWFVGYVSFLTPSGIGVRELVFIGLAASFEPDVVASMAVIGRASFLAVDVLLSLPYLHRAPGGG